MVKKIIALVLIAGACLFTTACEKQNKISKIGILMGSDLRREKIAGVIEGLEEYGYIDGENVKFIERNAKDQPQLLPDLAREIVNEDPDVIVVSGEVEAFAAKKVTRENPIPIVFVGVGIPVEIGLVESLSEPGGNITGVDNYYVKLSGKRLEFFKRLLPATERVAIIYNKNRTPAEPTVSYLKKVAKKLGLSLIFKPVTDREEAIKAVNTINPEDCDGIVLLCSLLMLSVTDDFYNASMEKGLPIMGVSESQVEKGLFASYSAPYREEGRQAARMVVNILNGQDPAQMPVEAPSTVQLTVNIETARRLGLNLDPEGLACAAKIIGEEKNANTH